MTKQTRSVLDPKHPLHARESLSDTGKAWSKAGNRPNLASRRAEFENSNSTQNLKKYGLTMRVVVK
jgi:hypothetical protein